MRPHSGLDIAAPTGTPIRAPAAGVVRLAEHDMYFEGGLVLLDHGHWLESAFLHLSRIDVAAGQRVEKGDIIGAVGATGRATGPHLHWSLKWTSRLVDPQLVLGEMPLPRPRAGARPARAVAELPGAAIFWIDNHSQLQQ
jgi:murein DD-endopeptidase MepM/ murein hydrolase activator NlpD